MITNIKYNTNPSILHMCGALNHLNMDMYTGAKDAYFEDVTILTAISDDREDRLRKYFSDRQEYLAGVNKGKWQNRLKIPIFYSLLQRVKTRYALLLDNDDVVVIRQSLDNEVYKHKALVQYSNKRNLPKFHVNSGCVFGERDFLLEWYGKTLDMDNYLTEWIKVACHPDMVKSDELRLNYTAVNLGLKVDIDERRILVQPPNYEEFYETNG